MTENESMTEQEVEDMLIEQKIENMLIEQEIEEVEEMINEWPKYKEGELEWMTRQEYIIEAKEKWEAKQNEDCLIRIEKFEEGLFE